MIGNPLPDLAHSNPAGVSRVRGLGVLWREGCPFSERAVTELRRAAAEVPDAAPPSPVCPNSWFVAPATLSTRLLVRDPTGRKQQRSGSSSRRA
jgi:hypothetical protein